MEFEASVFEGSVEDGEYDPVFWFSAKASSWWVWTAQESGFAAITFPVAPHVISYPQMMPWMMLVSTGATLQAFAQGTVARLELRPGGYAGFPVSMGQTYRIGLFGDGSTNLTQRVQIANSNSIIILRQPQSQTVRSGGTAFFEVFAPGVHPSNISWEYWGRPIPEAAGPTHYVPDVRVSVQGVYRAVLRYGTMVAYSDSAMLSVESLATPPLVRLIKGNSTNEFFIDLQGEPEAHYRIEGTDSFLFWRQLYLPDSGGYFVRPGAAMRIRSQDLLESPALFFRASRRGILKDECIVQLRRIELAKDAWAIERLKPAGTSTAGVDSEIDQFFYLGLRPRCPAGGDYTYHAIDTRPTCSVEQHSL